MSEENLAARTESTAPTVTDTSDGAGLPSDNNIGHEISPSEIATKMTRRDLTPKQEAFAQAYVETGNATEAHRRAGYGHSMSKKTRNEAASRLLADNKVRARIIELQEEHRSRHNVTVDTLTEEYEGARRLAIDIEQPSAANGATAGKARLHGLAAR